MTKLAWNQAGQNRYESGVDHGVFYTSDNLGYVWNGLTSVEEESEGGENTAYHFDGIKYLNMTTGRNYRATLSAFGLPTYFAKAIGDHAIIPGFILTRQPRERFGLSYRTGVGNPTGYKIHLVYNALASPSQRDYSTISDSVDPTVQAWVIDAVPVGRSTYRPSAHYILDSAKMNSDVLETFEDIIYGTDTEPARLPSIDELIDFITEWNPLLIMPQPTTGLSELVPGYGDLQQTTVDGIHRALPHTRLVKSPIDGLYRLE